MKALFELEFESAETAKKALQALDGEKQFGTSTLSFSVSGKTLVAEASAPSFSKLRAVCTSFLRRAKIVVDAHSIVSRESK